jgi:hypothetical protein
MERFAVVKRLANGSSVWVCTSDDLAEAKTKMLDLARKTGHEHFVHDFLVGNAVARDFDDKKAATSAAG